MDDNKLISKNNILKPLNAIPILILLFLLLLPLLITQYYLHVVILILMYAVLGSAWNWIGGFAGQMSLGNAVYFGLGGICYSFDPGMVGLESLAGYVGWHDRCKHRGSFDRAPLLQAERALFCHRYYGSGVRS